MDRLHFRLWLAVLDVAGVLDHGAHRLRCFTSKLYLWTVDRASDADPSWRQP